MLGYTHLTGNEYGKERREAGRKERKERGKRREERKGEGKVKMDIS